jgi:anti-sigma B factor antagonist
MSVSVDLYRDLAHQGGMFRTVPASHPSDYDCKPEGVLSYRHLEVGQNGDVIVVRLGNYFVLDELTVTKISEELLGVADRPDCHCLLLDFSGVAQLSSAMLAKLLILRRKMEPKGEKLRLCGLDSHLRSVFATTKLDRIFDITDKEVGAIQAVGTQSAPFAEKEV